jgi:hypothetical protein
MNRFSLDHVSDSTVERDLIALAARGRNTTAFLLAHIAEAEERQLYLPAACPSMIAYCGHVLGLREQAAFKHLRAARTARKFPLIFEALDDGRLHLAAVLLLGPHLTPETADELLAAASHKSKSEIERMLAYRFPRTATPAGLDIFPAAGTSTELSPGTPGDGLQLSPGILGSAPQLSPGTVSDTPQLVANACGQALQLSPGTVGRVKLSPIAPGLYSLQATIEQGTHDKLRRAQDLLSHSIPSGDLAKVLDRALEVMIGQLEKRKFAATAKPRANHRPVAAGSRHIPAHIRRAVRERDGDQCTFVSETGRRCSSRRLLEFDHVDEVARGGQASVDRIRLLCRAHNQYAAACTFGKEFMRRKREQRRAGAAACPATRTPAANEAHSATEAHAASETRAETKTHAAVEKQTATEAHATTETHAAVVTHAADATYPAREASASADAPASTEDLDTAKARAAAMAYARALDARRALEAKRAVDLDVTPWLRTLGFGAEERRIAACYCESMPEASLEQRVRAAIAFLRPGKPRTGRETWGHGEAASSSHAECAGG